MHVVLAIDDLGSGGAQRQLVELSTRLASTDGVRISVLVYRDRNFYSERLDQSGVSVVVLPKTGKADLLYAVRLARWLRSNDVDVLHAFLPQTTMWAFLAVHLIPRSRRPVLIPAERNTLQGISAGWMGLRRLIYPRVRMITANARSVAWEISEFLGVREDRITYIPNGIDSEYWTGAARLEPDCKVDPNLFNLAVVARLAPQKNHRLVLESLSLLPREEIRTWRIWFVGNEEFPALAASIRHEIDERGLKDIVRMVPPTRNIAAMLSRMDGLLLPSSREGFPNVVLEAMTLGVPVIASRVGGVPDMIDPGRTGMIIEQRDAGGLARAMSELGKMPLEHRRAMGQRGREVVKDRFSISAVARLHLELYRSVLAARGAG